MSENSKNLWWGYLSVLFLLVFSFSSRSWGSSRSCEQALLGLSFERRVPLNELALLSETTPQKNLLSEKAAEFHSLLDANLIGQNEAKIKFTDVYKSISAKYLKPNSPQGKFLLLGPTGSGKTEAVEVVALALHGDRKKILRVNMSEFQTKADVAKLFGAPPGYVGHEETDPIFTNAALDAVRSERSEIAVILLDEIEKAHDDVIQAFLQIFDKAESSTGQNERVDFKKTLIFMTSNISTKDLEENAVNPFDLRKKVGIEPPKADLARQEKSIIEKNLRRRFSPEFLDRLGDNIIQFHNLSLDERLKVLDLGIKKLNNWILNSLSVEHFSVRLTEDAKNFLVDQSPEKENGRGIKRAIDRFLLDPLAIFKISEQLAPGDIVEVGMDPVSKRLFFTAIKYVKNKEIRSRLDETNIGERGMIFKNLLNSKLIGQEEAKELLVSIYFRSIAQIADPTRPKGVVLFLGPPGTGKTEAAYALSEAIHGSRKILVLNMTEYQEDHNIAKIVGSPPGYAGHRSTDGVLSEQTLAKYRGHKGEPAIVLLDEIEKASDSVFKLFLQIFDKGNLRIGKNSEVDLTNVIFLMTGNLGSAEALAQAKGFGFGIVEPLNAEERHEETKRVVAAATRRFFSPEFRNRVDKTVVFESLGHVQRLQILGKKLRELEIELNRADGKNAYSFEISPEGIEQLMKESQSGSGRKLADLVDQKVRSPLANLMSSGQINAGAHVILTFNNGRWSQSIYNDAKGRFLIDLPEIKASQYTSAYEYFENQETLTPTSKERKDKRIPFKGIALSNRKDIYTYLDAEGDLWLSSPNGHRDQAFLLEHHVSDFAFAPTGNRLALASGLNLSVLQYSEMGDILEGRKRKPAFSVKIESNDLSAKIARLSWSGDGTFLSVLLTTGEVYVVDLLSGGKVQLVPASETPTSIPTRRVRFWSALTKHFVSVSSPQSNLGVYEIALRGNETQIAQNLKISQWVADSIDTGVTRDNRIVILRNEPLLQIHSLDQPDQTPVDIPLSASHDDVPRFMVLEDAPNAKYAAVRIDPAQTNSLGKSRVVLVDLQKNKVERVLDVPYSNLIQFAEGKIFLSNHRSHMLEVYALTGELLYKEALGNDSRHDFQVSPDGKMLMVIPEDRSKITLFRKK